MPDQLNKQTLINLLIDSPLREPIKINLIDIANNTTDPDLPKIFPTIVKELEIFQKATERRMKLAEETISKLGGTATEPDMPAAPSAPAESVTPMPPADLPPLPPLPDNTAITTPTANTAPTQVPPLSVPPLDLPPLPVTPTPPTNDTVSQTQNEPAPLPTPQPLGGSTSSPSMPSSDEAALAEIQKELDSLKAGVSADANPAPSTPAATS